MMFFDEGEDNAAMNPSEEDGEMPEESDEMGDMGGEDNESM